MINQHRYRKLPNIVLEFSFVLPSFLLLIPRNLCLDKYEDSINRRFSDLHLTLLLQSNREEFLPHTRK